MTTESPHEILSRSAGRGEPCVYGKISRCEDLLREPAKKPASHTKNAMREQQSDGGNRHHDMSAGSYQRYAW
jgi:hypothetical protein